MSKQIRQRDAAEDWKKFEPSKIPTKGIKLPPIFNKTLREVIQSRCSDCQPRDDDVEITIYILELGCGCGDLSLHLLDTSCNDIQSEDEKDIPKYKIFVLGLDINSDAIHQAQQKATLRNQETNTNGSCEFLVADVTGNSLVDDISIGVGGPVTCKMNSDNETAEAAHQYDFVILQLLLSIVGTQRQRKASLRNAWTLCRPGGLVYLSCSGISGDINPKYAQLYEQDLAATGERNTYFSRDAAKSNRQPYLENDGDRLVDDILYATHHFDLQELIDLLKETGFEGVDVEQKRETSSRRPDESAYFLYAVARRPFLDPDRAQDI